MVQAFMGTLDWICVNVKLIASDNVLMSPSLAKIELPQGMSYIQTENPPRFKSEQCKMFQIDNIFRSSDPGLRVARI